MDILFLLAIDEAQQTCQVLKTWQVLPAATAMTLLIIGTSLQGALADTYNEKSFMRRGNLLL